MDALLTVSVPVFGLILCGYLAGYFGVLGAQSSEALNRFVYYFALPALLFIFVARAPLERILYWPFLAAWGGSLVLSFGLTALLARLVYRDRLAVVGLRSMNASFANTGYMGIPLAITAFGEAAGLPAIIATAFMGIVLISLTIALIETDLSTKAGAGGIARDVGLALAKNPLVLSVAAGALVSAFGISIPLPLAKFFDLLSSAAGPCALFAIGLFISGQSVREGLHEAALITAIKLLVHPAIAWLLLAAVFEVEPLWATVTILIAALPTGANCFVLAQRYNVFVAPTSATILLSTALSVVTVSLLLILLR
ncbi:MAG: AEC family transporter [Nitrospira sp.]|nr:AEC family transporter [Nitrospira sp.]